MPIETLAQRLHLARTKRGLTQGELATQSGMKQPDISKIERGLILQTTGIARLSAALSVPPDWLELGTGQDPDWNAIDADRTKSPVQGVAQKVSYEAFKVPPLKTREDVLSGRNLGELFTYTVTDDATRDSYPRGLQIIFRTTGQPKIGRAVLVAHGDQVHVRIYGQGKSAGEWTANAEASGYLSFNSEDGSVIKGYYKGQIEADD